MNDIKNEKFGYAHPLVGIYAQIKHEGEIIHGPIIRVQEPVGYGLQQDTQTNIAIEVEEGELYCPLDKATYL